MKEMKYIVTVDDNGTEEIFLFPKAVNHDCFAEMATRIKNSMHGRWSRVHRRVIGAGFTNGITCYGRSESLRIDSRLEDSSLLG